MPRKRHERVCTQATIGYTGESLRVETDVARGEPCNRAVSEGHAMAVHMIARRRAAGPVAIQPPVRPLAAAAGPRREARL